MGFDKPKRSLEISEEGSATSLRVHDPDIQWKRTKKLSDSVWSEEKACLSNTSDPKLKNQKIIISILHYRGRGDRTLGILKSTQLKKEISYVYMYNLENTS